MGTATSSIFEPGDHLLKMGDDGAIIGAGEDARHGEPPIRSRRLLLLYLVPTDDGRRSERRWFGSIGGADRPQGRQRAHGGGPIGAGTMSEMNLETALSQQSGFRFGETSSLNTFSARGLTAPPLGPLAAFTGTYRGSGFNTIFRPEGSGNQPDIALNGVSYLQTITDVTVPSQPVGIHFEPGLWMVVPPTTIPVEGPTVFRMGSIPHGTTIEAQGTTSVIAGRPTIPAVGITPNFLGGGPQPFPSQQAANNNTARIPQNLNSFVQAGTITQAMLDDPNTFLRSHVAVHTVTSTTIISIATDPALPIIGGGTDNVAFLLGIQVPPPNQNNSQPNAQAMRMEATFWVETVEYTVEVPIFEPGQPPLIIPGQAGAAGQPVPEFLVNPPVAITAPRSIVATATQIQYSQHVFLNFNGLIWPHVSVATLVPASPVPVPASAF
jgi:hypothetical protein